MKKLRINLKKVALLALAFCPMATLAMLASANQASALVDTPWGPDRKTFTWADPAPYATWNSITDNPQLGDERNFVRIREVADGSRFVDQVDLEVGKTYEVYIYYHNNADGHEVGQTAIGIADGAAVKSSFPATVKQGQRATVTGTLMASDTDPKEVWDGAYMMPTQDLYLRYVPGTATIHNGGQLNGQNIGPEYLFGDGALLGYNQFSGILPGCNQYAGYITYQVFADAPNFTMEKTIESGSSVVKPGDEVTFKIHYENTGTMNQQNVVVQDTLSDNLTYIPGSTILYNNNNPDGKAVNDDIITEHGMSIGDYAGGSGWADVVYKARVNENVICTDLLVNSARVSTTDGDRTDQVELSVECEETCATNPELPGCQELPKTGPVEVAIATLIVGGIGGAGYYLYSTRRTLRTVQSQVTGATPKHGTHAGAMHRGSADQTETHEQKKN